MTSSLYSALVFGALVLLTGGCYDHQTDVPASTVPCKLSNGQDRPQPCEFEILGLEIRGQDGQLLGTITPANKTLVLPRSLAESNTPVGTGGVLFYAASLVLRRINKPFFATDFYTLSTSTTSGPIGSVLVTEIDKKVVAPPGVTLPNPVSFKVQLSYDVSGGQPTLIAPIQYVDIANPVTATNYNKSTDSNRDRAEASLSFQLSVNFSK